MISTPEKIKPIDQQAHVDTKPHSILDELTLTSTLDQQTQTEPTQAPTIIDLPELPWQFSALMAQTLRLVGHKDYIQDEALSYFCSQIQGLDLHIERLENKEKKLIQFLLRDWIIQTFSESGSSKLIRMQTILRDTDITGVIAGRKRAIETIAQNPNIYQHALGCLNLIHQVSPEYTDLAEYTL